MVVMKKWGEHKGSLPTLNYLIALEATSRLGSFRAAAEDMCLTQGAVAQQIRALEKELGAPLFDRLPRGLSANKKGSDYINRLSLALGIVEEATRDFTEIKTILPSSQIRLSTTPSFASRWLLPHLPLINEKYPEISMMIDASATVRSFKGEKAIDMSIRWGTPPFPEGYTQFLHDGRATPVCAPELLGNKKSFSVNELIEHSLISDSHDNWKAWFDNYVEPHPDNRKKMEGAYFSHTNHALDAVEQGMGIALVPNFLVQRAISIGTLVHATNDQYQLESQSAFYIITEKEPKADSSLAKVIDWLLMEAKKSNQYNDESVSK